MYSRQKNVIGVCSYLLIGYWSHRLSASKSALKAVVVNRLSDGLLLWGVLWVWWHTGSLEYDIVTLSTETSAFMSTAILIGAMGKSAQVGFHVWLADAMEGKYYLYLYYVNFIYVTM
jgi:NADH:ubiquinone oxidoreductase subunit 5 (subunit L)/multisubunit Na+/H+ antiporter MnhA subunit